MQNDRPNAPPKQSAEAVRKAQGEEILKNQNPNQSHNTKKESLGRNTKR